MSPRKAIFSAPEHFHGVCTALVTPFKPDGGLDVESLQNLVVWQIEHGVDSILVAGTTGESACLTHEEHSLAIKLCVEAAEKKVPIIAGTGSNSTQEAVSLSRRAEADGADALLLVTPYYNKPSQNGMRDYFQTVAHSVGIPVFVYNIPSRTASNISVESLKILAKKCPNIFGIKDADPANLPRIIFTSEACGADFVQLSGDDATFPAFLAMGGHGCVSVCSNVAPSLLAEIWREWREGELKKFARLRTDLTILHKALFQIIVPRQLNMLWNC